MLLRLDFSRLGHARVLFEIFFQEFAERRGRAADGIEIQRGEALARAGCTTITSPPDSQTRVTGVKSASAS